MVLGVPVVHVMLWCGVVRRVGWVACGGRLRWGVVVMQLVGVAVVFGHQGVGVLGGGGVVMVLVVPLPWPCLKGGPGMAWMCAGGCPLPGCRVRVLWYGGGGGPW